MNKQTVPLLTSLDAAELAAARLWFPDTGASKQQKLQAIASDDAVVVPKGMREEIERLLEQIDLKAEAGLCQMSFGGAREFLKDIRKLVKEDGQRALNGEKA